jgi:hypothetical protein
VEGAKADDGEVVKITTANEKRKTVAVVPANRCPPKILIVVV